MAKFSSQFPKNCLEKIEMAPTRIAIIGCDPLIESIRKTYGDYGGVVIAFLQAGAEHVGLPLDEFELSVWNVKKKHEYSALKEIDSIVMTDSNM